MSSTLEVLLFGVGLGFSLAVPPGPMNAWIASRAARSYRSGVITGMGAMTADGILGLVVYLVDRGIDVHPAVRIIYLLGAGVMAYFGARLLRPAAGGPGGLPDERTFLYALFLGLSNPFQVVWWLTAGIAFAYLGGATLLIGLFGAIVVWIVTFPWVVRRGAQRVDWLETAIRVVSAAILIGFAGYFVALFVLG